MGLLLHTTIDTGGLTVWGTRDVSEAQPTRTWSHPMPYSVHLVGRT